MPRGYASSEVSERDYLAPRSSNHRARSRNNVTEYDEVDIREHRRRAPAPSAPEPEFLREDYGRRSDAGPLVVRERERSRDRERPRRGGGVREEEEIVIERREKSRERPRRRERKEEFVEEDALIVEKPRRRERDVEREVVEEGVIVPVPSRRREEEIVYREDVPPPRPVRTERENFEFYRRERDLDREEYVPPPRREPVAPMPPVAPVRSEREVFEYRPKVREPSPEPEREEIIIKEERREKERPRYREERDEEIIIRERSRERPRYREDEEIIIREKSRERPRYREEEEIILREREREREKTRYLEERDSLTVRTDERVRARSRGDFEESDALVIRRTEGGGRSRAHSTAASRGDYREEEISIRERERDPPRRVRSPSRDREEITLRHDDRGGRRNDEIVIRRNERSPSPESVREPEPIIRPPVVQEVITHHRHIDHGIERAPSPPRPRSPSPFRDDRIEIRHRSTTSNGRRYDDDIIFERERGGRRELEGVRRGNDRYSEEDYSGALVRSTERDLGPPVRYEARQERKDRLWTEITKDLVSEEAIREKGYEFEEAETSWFVMEHLRYDDVLALTELTEEIRADRRDRISEIQAEREMGPPPLRRPVGRDTGGQWDEERIIEREVVYDGPPPSGAGRGWRGPPPRGYR